MQNALDGKDSYINDLVRLSHAEIKLVVVHGNHEIKHGVNDFPLKSNLDTTLLFEHLEHNPIVMYDVSLMFVDDGQTLYCVDVNLAAAKVAIKVGAEKLIMLTNVASILEEVDDPKSLVENINFKGVKKMIEEGRISGEMLMKAQSCLKALLGAPHSKTNWHELRCLSDKNSTTVSLENSPVVDGILRKIIVVKIGGKTMQNALDGKDFYINDFVRLSHAGIKLVVVHGIAEIKGGVNDSPLEINVDPTLLFENLEHTPIFVYDVSFVLGDDGQTLYFVDVNLATAEVAIKVGAVKLIMLTDVAGILEEVDDPKSLVKNIDFKGVKKMIEEGQISGEMLMNAQNCLKAFLGDVLKAAIVNGGLNHSLLVEIRTEEGVVKVGGEAMENALNGKDSYINDLVHLSHAGIKLVVVHGKSEIKRGVNDFPLEINTLYCVDVNLVAAEVAIKVRVEKLFMLTDVASILEEVDDPKSLVKNIDFKGVRKTIEEGQISGEMLMKAQSCLKALLGGIPKAAIVKGGLNHMLLVEILTEKGGTKTTLVE
ncbi:hypothetical protein BUALT_Bualt13G0116000 [Buddleja alternifolia]|uniref:Aspartate/glutamate/uridylate kinase domain-containing protein n=1 Tax=Buddleja alternifolia TaxID=168488 RepID=A0AAV6WS50_9LAMI|nr:hypothetical protein BUALT_Bualt13G0116000 [Buddleja alternifolia]